jgi:polyhydroxyalkanoate synthase
VKRKARVCGILVVVIAVATGLVLLLKSRISGPPRIPLDEPSPFRAPEPETADDLSEVKGIGPVYRSRLADAGIVTFAQLASADPQTVAGHAAVSERAAADWITQASELAAH